MVCLHIALCIHTPLVQLCCVKGEPQTTVQKNLEVALKLLSGSSAVEGEAEDGLYNLVQENMSFRPPQRTVISPAQTQRTVAGKQETKGGRGVHFLKLKIKQDKMYCLIVLD